MKPAAGQSLSVGLRCFAAVVFIAVFPAAPLPAADVTTKQIQFFESKIRPLLAENCYTCHSLNANPRFANLRLDSRAGMLTGGGRGPVIVPGNPSASQLIQAVRHENLRMPPTGKLAEAKIAALVEWVEMGAPWPREETIETVESGTEAKSENAAGDHWAWKPVRKSPPPGVRNDDWPLDPIDHFILRKLESEDFVPNPDADRYTLLRRIYLDLTGLPPTPEEIEAFVNDDSAGALEKIVDRLLLSPDFGERWGRHWLDLTSYADSMGVGRHIPAKEAWRYRDYVIASFNSDKPYDRFVREQVAGEMLDWEIDEQRREQVIATGFLAIGPWSLVDADKEQLRMDVVDNQIDSIGRVFLGLTLGCARCHDHKFDPIPTREYYALAGIFRSTRTLNGRISHVFSDVNRTLLPEPPEDLVRRAAAVGRFQKALAEANEDLKPVQAEKDRLEARKEAFDKDEEASTEKEAVEKEIEAIDKKLEDAKKRVGFLEFTRPGPPMAFAVADRPEPENCRINIRGNPRMLGDEVARGFLSIASTKPPPRFADRRDLKGSLYRSSGRLELADWLVDPESPLTARVMVNRIWHHLFGAGLVRTVDNFGHRGEAPSHPKLLDYLAARFVEGGWSVKSMVRKVVLTRTYRQSSRHNPAAHHLDPENRLLWRANRRRLEAEVYRDALLAISGNLDRTRGGPSLSLDAPDSLASTFPYALNREVLLRGRVRHRRTVYVPTLRKSQVQELDVLNLFDFPDPNQASGARAVTTVPTQSLYLMNSPFLREQSRLAAQRLLDDNGRDDVERVSRFIMKTLNRPALEPEVSRAREFVQSFQAALAGLAEPPDDPRLEAWTRYCQAVFVSNEFLFRG